MHARFVLACALIVLSAGARADDRWQTAADLAAELKYITERLHTGVTPDDREKSTEPVRSRGRLVWRTALALGLIAFATWLVWQTHPSEPALVTSSQRPIGAFGVSYRQATVSPDGGLIAFAEHGTPGTQIWIKK